MHEEEHEEPLPPPVSGVQVVEAIRSNSVGRSLTRAEPTRRQARASSREPRAPRSRRRQRRWEHDRELAWLKAAADDDDEDTQPSRLLTTVNRELIADPKSLGDFLECRGRTMKARRSKGTLLAREAARGWLRVERKLRRPLRKAAAEAPEGLAKTEARLLAYLAGLPLSTDENGRHANGAQPVESLVLDRPADRRLVHALAQFHGCSSKSTADKHMVIIRLKDPSFRLNCNVRLADALRCNNSSLSRLGTTTTSHSPSPRRAPLRAALPSS